MPRDDRIEGRRGGAMHDRHEVTHQAAIAVTHQARISSSAQQPGQIVFGKADVAEGLQHSWHGYGCTRAHRDQQRTPFAAEAARAGFLEAGEPSGKQFSQLIVPLSTAREVFATNGSSQNERGRDRKSQLREPQQAVCLRSHGRRARRFLRAGASEDEEQTLSAIARARLLLKPS